MSDTEFDPEDFVDPFEKQLEARAEEARRRAALAGRTRCEECEAPIPEARRAAIGGVRFCVDCQAARDLAGSRTAAGRAFG